MIVMKAQKILVGVLAILGVTFVGLIISSLMMGYGPFTLISIIVWTILELIAPIV